MSLFLYFFFFPISSVLAPRCPVRATSSGAFLCAFLAHHCASPLFLVVASDGIRQKSGEVTLTASLSWSFRGIIPLLRPFSRNCIPLSYLTSCPVRVYSFSPRRMKIWPSRRILEPWTWSLCTSSKPCAPAVVNVPDSVLRTLPLLPLAVIV